MDPIENTIGQTFKILFETMHLYRSVMIKLPSREKAKNQNETLRLNTPEGAAMFRAMDFLHNRPWNWSPPGQSPAANIVLPVIKIFCSEDDRHEPFHPKALHKISLINTNKNVTENLMIEYQCQSCGQSTVFLVRRAGPKMWLTGRSPIEQILVHKDIPKSHKKFISDAILASNSGQVLPGLFMLRTFIEQYTKGQSEIPNLLADKYVEEYMRKLPEDFKQRFPSLSKLYEELSLALHTANESQELFDKTLMNLYEHFEAKRLYKI